MEWLKQLPNWIKGTIAFFTAVIGFITVFKSNLQLSVTVSVAMILIAAFTYSIYAAFGKKPSDVSGEKSAYRFPDHRWLAFAGIMIIPLLSIGLLKDDQIRNAVIIAFNGSSTEPMQIIGEPHNPGSLTYSFVIQNNTDKQQFLDEIRILSDVTPGVEKQEKCPLSSNATVEAPVQSVAEDPIYVDVNEPNHNQTMESILGTPTHNNVIAPAVPPKAQAGTTVEPVRNYLIYFDVNESNHNLTMKPMLTIPDHDYVSFDVSLIPQQIEICEDWSSKITLVVKNTDGVSVQTEPLMINTEILDAAKQ